MCGIAGIVALDPDVRVAENELRPMAAALTHRGPDDEGFYVDPHGRCALAFRRLAIIDLVTGNQPMPNESGDVQVVFNGEIYNFRELRQQLAAAGHRFRSKGDSEVLVHLYEEHGDRFVEHLAGMFAIALWDARAGRLLLARDRLGQKPLVWAIDAGRFYFASELKALLANPGLRRRLNPQALHQYLVFQYVPAPWTIYDCAKKLGPARRLSIPAHRRLATTEEQYWHVPTGRFEGSFDEATERLDLLLRQAVRRRLIADVPLGAFLSGGVDSSIVVALMRELGVEPLRTFTIGFPDRLYDERRYARIVADHFATDHHEFVVTPDARQMLDVLAYYYDEPFADSSAIATCCVAQCARACVTVALTGDAGDECFAGYDRYHAARLAGLYDTLPQPVRRLLARSAERLPHGRSRTVTNRLYRLLSVADETPARRYLGWVGVFSPESLRAALREPLRDRTDFEWTWQWFAELFERQCGPVVERANRVDVETYLPFDLLTKVDIASMAASLECRSPFLDHELLGFALTLPMRWRMGKRILKRWATGRLPREILTRPKMGFGVPLGRWFRNELSDLLDELIQPGAFCAQIFEPAWLRGLIDAHRSGRADHAHRLWALVMLERWAARWRPDLPI